MNKLPANANNNKISRISNKNTEKQYAKCQQLSATKIMGNNTSRRRARRRANIPNVATGASVSSASVSHAAAMPISTAQPVRKRYARKTYTTMPARSKFESKAVSEVTLTLEGKAPDACASIQIDALMLDSITKRSNLLNTTEEVTKNLTASCGAPNSSASAGDFTFIVGSDFSTAADTAYRSGERSSSFHATRKIADVSKTTDEKTDIKIAHTKAVTDERTPKTVRTTRAVSAVASQLTKANTTAIKYTTITAAETASVQSKQAEVGKQTVEVCSGELRRTQSVDRLTSPPTTIPISADAQVEVTLAAVDMKSKFRENKCALAVLTNVSNQRKLEASSTISVPAQCTPKSNRHRQSNINNNNQLLSNRWSSVHNTAKAEYVHTSFVSGKDLEQPLTLAARKAKLKSEFFRDFELHEAASKRLTKSTIVIDVCGKDLVKPCFDKGTRTPPSLPATVLPTIAVNESKTDASISIVAKRKLDLKRKFEQQSAPKTSPTSDHHFIIGASSVFPRVEKLVQKFDTKSRSTVRKMIVNPNKPSETTDSHMLTLKPDVLEQRNSPLSDEGCNLGQSPYSSDNDDNDTTSVDKSKRKEKVARSASSDSALGLEVDEAMDTTPAQPPAGTQQRRMTLTVTDLPLRPALLPLAEPTALPESPTIDLQPNSNILPTQNIIPSKVLLEERVVELPEDPRSLAPSQPCSRRESAQSFTSDFTAAECPGGRRFVRTPSVVVSDYSDEVMCGITLEEIEYFRAQRMRRRHSSLDTANEGEGESDVSASSSCSNLYYCGSTISALDGNECYVNGVRTPLDRKTSACSTCSASADEESFSIPEDPPTPNKDLADLLAAQHLSTKPTTKKVGLVVPMNENLSERAPY